MARASAPLAFLEQTRRPRNRPCQLWPALLRPPAWQMAHPDPLGLKVGPNLYAYVLNNPMTMFDLYGLLEEERETTTSNTSDQRSDSTDTYRDDEMDWDSGISIRDGLVTIRNGLVGLRNKLAELSERYPRVQGSMHAFSGAIEAGIGAGVALKSGGIFGAYGWVLFAHGTDQCVTGMKTLINGKIEAPATSQLLQMAGMGPQTAGLVDSSISIGGTILGAAIIRGNQLTSFPAYRLPAPSTMNPHDIRFSQDSISNAFRQGGTIDDLANALRSGAVHPYGIPPIRLVSRDGLLYSLDNRRLEAFRRTNLQIPYRMATAEEIENEAWKFSTKNQGTSVYTKGSK